jgi:hypothetical protein
MQQAFLTWTMSVVDATSKKYGAGMSLTVIEDEEARAGVPPQLRRSATFWRPLAPAGVAGEHGAPRVDKNGEYLIGGDLIGGDLIGGE